MKDYSVILVIVILALLLGIVARANAAEPDDMQCDADALVYEQAVVGQWQETVDDLLLTFNDPTLLAASPERLYEGTIEVQDEIIASYDDIPTCLWDIVWLIQLQISTLRETALWSTTATLLCQVGAEEGCLGFSEQTANVFNSVLAMQSDAHDLFDEHRGL